MSRRTDLRINGYVVGQLPNPPLIVAALAAVVHRVLELGGTLLVCREAGAILRARCG